ncbi:AraC family transcriptional regulator [Crossiella sp. CA-258035]|uniref:AraC family transcriptional regulator n=1 Tax=Crossiella sp. CA-258035 TaxID=2981138 RepID=UPI0024BD59F9|nr:AraC family transcriptional regulator [Crossiella sp. CA-258035]WHT15705.1 AraC family transcriptional regulator [Crossiella sp. CA-258035]
MDLLSDVLTVLRTGNPRSAHVTWHGNWRQDYAEVPGAAGFHVVLQGECTLRAPTELHLAKGDILFLPTSPNHTLTANSPADAPVPPSLAAHMPGPASASPSPAANAPGPAPGPPDHPAHAMPAPADTSARHVRATTPGPGPITTVTLCGAYELTPARTHPLLRTLPATVHLPVATQPPELTAARTLLARELTSPGQGTDALIPALLDTLFVYLLRGCLTATGTGWSAALRDPATAAALQAMHDNPAHPWTVAKLAAEAGLSRAPFARRFTTLVGQPPLTYLTWWRMTTAARLLRETADPVGVIAARVGYLSEFALATAFKRAFGQPPGRYRRR